MELPAVNLSLILLLEDQNSSSENDNVTTESLDEIVLLNEQFKPVIDSLLLLVLIIIMCSMGCEITWKQVNKRIFFFSFRDFCIAKKNIYVGYIPHASRNILDFCAFL